MTYQAQALADASKSQIAAAHWHWRAVERRDSGDAQGAILAQIEAAAWHHDSALDVAFGAGLDSYESMVLAALARHGITE